MGTMREPWGHGESCPGTVCLRSYFRGHPRTVPPKYLGVPPSLAASFTKDGVGLPVPLHPYSPSSVYPNPQLCAPQAPCTPIPQLPEPQLHAPQS